MLMLTEQVLQFGLEVEMESASVCLCLDFSRVEEWG